MAPTEPKTAGYEAEPEPPVDFSFSVATRDIDYVVQKAQEPIASGYGDQPAPPPPSVCERWYKWVSE